MSEQTPAQLAKRLGVGMKALRLWEDEGLIKPHRLANGWRVFQDSDVLDTWRVSALKRMGFSLKAIKALLHRGAPSFEVLLSVQAEVLAQQAKEIARATAAIAQARAILQDGAKLDVDILIKTHMEVQMSDPFSNPVLEKLWSQTYTPDQIAALKARPMNDEETISAGKRWSELIAEAERLRVIGDHQSPAALDLAKRWMEEVELFTKGDAGLNQSAFNFYTTGFSDPNIASQMPFSEGIWQFVGRSVAVLKARGDL
jgi:MerR family transcriptional regulator, thiopeptide resistance regulator